MVLTNSVSVKAFSHNPFFHVRKKHIEVNYYFICVVQGQLVIEYIPLVDRVANALIKPFPRSSILFLSLILLMLPPPSICEGLLALVILIKLACVHSLLVVILNCNFPLISTIYIIHTFSP